MENGKSERRTFIPVSVELRDRLKVLKGKGVSYERFITDLIGSVGQKDDPSVRSDNTHTHKGGVADTMEWIERNNPKGITKSEIHKAIKETKGMDLRTIKKYEPEVVTNLLLLGYQAHPSNPNLFVRYEISGVNLNEL